MSILKIDFPVDSYEVPSLPGKYRRLLVPPDTMALDKFSLFNYGLTDMESFLDKSIHKPSFLRRTINPNKTFREISDQEILCGSVNLNLKSLK